jgi:hypothetical protein
MQRNARPRRILGVGALVLGLLMPLAAMPADAAPPPTPSVKLWPSRTKITLVRQSRRSPVSLNFGVYVAAVNGAFELHVARADYDSPIQASQWVGGTDIPLPDGVTDGFMGLKDFSSITLRTLEGKAVARQTSTWCPASYDRGRVDDSGPMEDPYPGYGCPYNPFTLGTVMGIEDGWAAALDGGYGYGIGIANGSAKKGRGIKDGRYTATVSIREPFRTLFSIPAADASVTLQIKVVTHPTCKTCYGQGHERPMGPQRSPAALPRIRARDIPTDTNPAPSTVPDIIALPASQMYVERSNGHDYLVFGATVWDAGPAPLEVQGFRRPNSDTMDSWQYFYNHQGDVVGKARVGRMEYDARQGHQHWHFRQFARYSLTDTNKTQMLRSHKEAFCLAPTDPIDLLAPGAQLDPYQIGLGSACGSENAIWVRETLPAGWGDTYYQWLPGQSFDVTDLPNGRYFVKVQVNTNGKLYEADTSNNISYRRVFLRGRPGNRYVLVPAWHGLDGPCC